MKVFQDVHLLIVTAISVASALGLSLILTPVARRIAKRYRIHAAPNHRSVHKKFTPKLGGLAIYLAFSTSLIFGASTQFVGDLGVFVLGGGVVLFVGLLDDLYHLTCYRKLMGQIAAAVVAVHFGFKFDGVYLPSGITMDLGNWTVPLSIFWIVGITNAVNLLDGLDGLASGFSAVTAFTIFLGAMVFQNLALMIVALVLVAATLGFLKYNLNPARIFLGDTGSLFLGYILACLSLKVFTIPEAGSHMLVLAVLFLVPIADTFLSVARRMSYGQHPFIADKKHIHHRLLELGFSHRSAVFVMFAATFVCGVLSLILYTANLNAATILLSSVSFLSYVVLSYLGCFDFLYKRRISRSSLSHD